MPLKSSTRNDQCDLESLKIFSESSDNLPIVKDAVNLLRDDLRKIRVTVRKFPRRKKISDANLSKLINLRLIDPADKNARAIDSFAIRDFERRVLSDAAKGKGVPYEGIGLMKFYREYVTGLDSFYPELGIVVTDRLVMTWSDDDLRYHARVVVFGVPCVISMSGLVEAPARPREYYLAKQAIESIGGVAEASLREQFSGKYLDYEDDRTVRVLRGYLLQCVFYGLTGEPFCEEPDCILFNAHWQEEMINAQIKSGSLCKKHLEMIS